MPPNPKLVEELIEQFPAFIKGVAGGADDAAKAATKTATKAEDVAEEIAKKTAKTGKSKKAAEDAADSATDAAKKAKKKGIIRSHPKTAIGAGLLGAGVLGATAVGADRLNQMKGAAGDTFGDKLAAFDKWLLGDGSTDNPFTTTSGEDIIEVDPVVMAAFIAALREHADDLTAALTAAPKAFGALREKLTKDTMGTSTRSGAASPIFEDLDSALEAAEARYTSVVKALISQFSGDAARLEAIVRAHMENEQTHAQRVTEVAV